MGVGLHMGVGHGVGLGGGAKNFVPDALKISGEISAEYSLLWMLDKYI